MLGLTICWLVQIWLWSKLARHVCDLGECTFIAQGHLNIIHHDRNCYSAREAWNQVTRAEPLLFSVGESEHSCLLSTKENMLLRSAVCFFLSFIHPSRHSPPSCRCSQYGSLLGFPSTWLSSLLAFSSQIQLHWSTPAGHCPYTCQTDVYMCTELQIICLLIQLRHFGQCSVSLLRSSSLPAFWLVTHH